jgi:hypothetical protein
MAHGDSARAASGSGGAIGGRRPVQYLELRLRRDVRSEQLARGIDGLMCACKHQDVARAEHLTATRDHHGRAGP